MLEYPIASFKENMVISKKKEAWSYYKVTSYTAGLNNREKENQLKYLLKNMATQLQSFGEIDYKIIPFPVNISKIIDKTAEQYKGPYERIGRYYANRAKTILNDEVGDSVEYKCFIGVKLKELNEDEGKWQEIKNAIQGIKSTFQSLSGLKTGGEEEIIKRFKASEEEAFSAIHSYLEVDRCMEEELKYLLRKQFLRGQREPEGENSLYSLTEGVLDPGEYGYLKIEQLESESYVSFLPVSMFPIDMENSAWANAFQHFPFPIEMNIRTVYKGKEKDYKETNTIKKRFREQDEQLILANEDEDTLINQGRQLLFELENAIKNENKPLIRTFVHFVVWGTTKKECKRRAKELKRYFKGVNWEVVQPLADQMLLFHQSIPASELKANDWQQQLTPESFAESFFSLSRKIGNHVGFYLGKDISMAGETKETSNQLVFFNPFAGSQGIKGSKYSSPHVTISGPTGMGKSFLTKDIILNAIFYGARVLITDPKNEMQKMLDEFGNEHFRTLIESFNFITFSAENSDAGKLDPMTFLAGEESHDAAIAVLEYLLQLDNKERGIKTAISEAVRKVIGENQPGLLKVVKLLQDSQEKEVREAGNYLYELGTNGLAKLLFSNGKTEGISLKKQVNVLQIQNLSLPENGEKPATRDEYIAVALMIPLAKFSAKFSRNAKELAITIFEEAWMLSNTGQGDRLIKEMLRTGRSLQSYVYLVTQSIVDYNKPDIKEGIGTKFAFKAKTNEEASAILEYLGLEDNSDNREMLKNLTEGECIMEDIFGRTAKIKTDVLFNEWVQAFNTKPSNEKMVELEEAMVL